MDIVASPVSDTKSATSRFPDPSRPSGDLMNSQYITTQEASDHPSELTKPPLLKHVSSPAYNSPLRHHRRNPSTPHQVKETLNARSEYVTSQDDGSAEHRINQYVIKQEIGRGSFGAVHVAIDQYGKEYAVKEFSKARLRKRAQSNILRKPLSQRRRARGALQGFNSPLHRRTNDDATDFQENPLELIKEEIAIMKKLHHPNLVQLIEVLDDPAEDSLYVVMEMCKKGVVMRIDLDLDSRADPYPEETCRLYFRDLILGVEYLHAQGVVHRDIKPDNCLINHEDVLKVVDFGVSEMFAKDSEMLTAKSAGSPAFLPPELCVVRHGDVSGRAADIWSMGVTLYCLKTGSIPFQKQQLFDLYDAIKTDQPDLSKEKDPQFRDLMTRLLEKDPSKRIRMSELRAHPWVTKNDTDPLLSEAENTAEMIDPPTDAEVDAAITGDMRGLMTVVKAVKKFKSLTEDKRPPVMSSILGDSDTGRFSLPPGQMKPDKPSLESRSKSVNLDDRAPVESALVAEGVHRELAPTLDIPTPDSQQVKRKPVPVAVKSGGGDEADLDLARLRPSLEETDEPSELAPFRSSLYHARTTDDIGRKGHAHDPLEDQLYLRIGPSTFAGHSTQDDTEGCFVPDDEYIVSESPGAADVDIYETAYRDEIERILARAHEQNEEPQVYLTRRVDEKLLQLSGLAGKLMAHGDNAKSQFMDYTQFKERRARVAEVSRALREASRAEYEKRRQERKDWIEAARTEKAKAAPARSNPSMPLAVENVQTPTRPEAKPEQVSPKPLETSSSWRVKAADRGRYAKTAFSGLVKEFKKGRKPQDDVS
ncbi:hypothetical protein LTR64_004932 [Lithohypha guttulata]|uniref:uncharacterized protein n=1 Tax=Lithohypha guttulata TaxID=1690604 RepID=UPI002DE0E4F1|nr:hypothetical protein LTR51_005231 [Lithohypha guttulata]